MLGLSITVAQNSWLKKSPIHIFLHQGVNSQSSLASKGSRYVMVMLGNLLKTLTKVEFRFHF